MFKMVVQQLFFLKRFVIGGNRMSKVVLITGAGTGLGRAEQGYRLSLVDLNEKDGLETAERAKELGGFVSIREKWRK